MKKALLLAASVAFVAPQVFAQAKNFEGFSLGANLAFANTTTEPTGVASQNGNTTGLDLQAQYSFALAPQFVLGVGLTLGTGSNNAGTFAPNTEITTKNRTAIDIMPGYALSSDMLLFGKVSVVNADVESSTPSAKASVNGMGYGVGLRGLIDKNMFYQVGYDAIQINETTLNGIKAKGSSSVFSLGVGYKF